MLLVRKHKEQISWTRPFFLLHRLTHQQWSQPSSNRAELHSVVRWIRNWGLWHTNRNLQLVGWLVHTLILHVSILLHKAVGAWNRAGSEPLYLKAKIMLFSFLFAYSVGKGNCNWYFSIITPYKSNMSYFHIITGQESLPPTVLPLQETLWIQKQLRWFIIHFQRTWKNHKRGRRIKGRKKKCPINYTQGTQ